MFKVYIVFLNFPTVKKLKPSGTGSFHPFFRACETLGNIPARNIIWAIVAPSSNLSGSSVLLGSTMFYEQENLNYQFAALSFKLDKKNIMAITMHAYANVMLLLLLIKNCN